MPTESLKKRVQYVITFMQTGSKAKALKASGLGRNAHERIIKLLVNNCSLEDSPRTGAGKRYTEGILQQCLTVLIEDTTGLMTGVLLHSMCLANGVLWKGSDIKHFLLSLKAYVHKLGHKLNTRSESSTFFLASSDFKLRVDFAKELIEDSNNPDCLRYWIFVDETTVEESPHPKGTTTAPCEGCAIRACHCVQQRNGKQCRCAKHNQPPVQLMPQCRKFMPCMHGTLCIASWTCLPARHGMRAFTWLGTAPLHRSQAVGCDASLCRAEESATPPLHPWHHTGSTALLCGLQGSQGSEGRMCCHARGANQQLCTAAHRHRVRRLS